MCGGLSRERFFTSGGADLFGGEVAFAFEDGVELVGAEVFEAAAGAGAPANLHEVDGGGLLSANRSCGKPAGLVTGFPPGIG
jgi:hypothetical protein